MFVLQLISRLYYYIFDRFILYPMMKCVSKTLDVQFMNLGYALSQKDQLKIKPFVDNFKLESDKHYNNILLYEKCLSYLPYYPSLANLDVLEVGCGLGGGIKWIMRTRPEIATLQGIDKVVTSDLNGLAKECSAENLFLKPDSINVILNVESSHLYSSTNKFFIECFRVLKAGGYLCWTDLRYNNQMKESYRQAKQCGFKLVDSDDITEQVILGVQKTSKKYDEMLGKTPWPARLFSSSIRSTYCAPGTVAYNRFVTREKVYHAACWQKPETKN